MPSIRKRCPRCPTWQPCPTHQRAYDRRRPSPPLRGYRQDPGSPWQRVRRAVLSRDPVCMWGTLARDRLNRIERERMADTGLACLAPPTDVAHLSPRRGPWDDLPELCRGLCHSHHSRETATLESFSRAPGVP